MPSRPIPNPMPNNSLVGDRALGDMSHLERADLLRRLQLLTGSEFNPSQRRRVAGRWFVRFLAVCCLVLIPWTAGLAVSLPRHYVASNWRLAWTFFDVALFCCLTVTAWALWKQRLIVVPASTITSVLLLCDAWFDIMTAHGHRDLVVSTASALVAELPLAVMLLVLLAGWSRMPQFLHSGVHLYSLQLTLQDMAFWGQQILTRLQIANSWLRAIETTRCQVACSTRQPVAATRPMCSRTRI
jgi:hypothetical protein